jgi:nucleoside-diphosphate-sugar epimerase
MRIAVTGADGRIGRAVVDRALAMGHEVVALDRAAEQVPRPGVTRHPVDVTDYRALVTRIVGCDALVHLAAITSPGHLPDDVVHDHNVTGSYHALRAAAEVGITRVCQASSVNAIGGRFSREARYDYFPVDVAHPTYAEDPYSLSKWICEQQADAATRRFDVSVVSLRFHGVVPTRADALPWNEAMPDAVARQLWGYTTLESSARACLDAVTSDIDGHHVCNIVAADTMTDVPTLELCEQYYPDVPIRADLSGHRGLFEIASTTELLGWTPDPLDTEAPA